MNTPFGTKPFADSDIVNTGTFVDRSQDQAYIAKLHTLWGQRKKTYIDWIAANNLYDVQEESNSLLIYAANDYWLLDEMLSVYLGAINTLVITDQYQFYYYQQSGYSTHTLLRPCRMWLKSGIEELISISQFLYLIADALNIVSKIGNKSATMIQFTDAFKPVLIDHYQRWIFDPVGPFQVRGWGCWYSATNEYVQTAMNHYTFLTKMLNRDLGDSTSYCNSVGDTDMWIIAGVAKLAATFPEITHCYTDYIDLGVSLLKSRMTTSSLTNLNGTTVQGNNFDIGVWDDHPDYAYAGYTCQAYPTTPVHKVGTAWDISHARRFVNVFQALYDNKAALGLTWPSLSAMQRLANQFVYGTFNRNFETPLFTNFMNGDNGWYRVGYAGQPNFGYGPYDLSDAAITGGYAWWGKYNADIRTLYAKLETMINSTDQVMIQFLPTLFKIKPL